MRPKTLHSTTAAALALLISVASLSARQWTFPSVPNPVEAEFVSMSNDYVVLQGENGKSFELPLANFSPADQEFIRSLASVADEKLVPEKPGKPITSRTGYKSKSVETLAGQFVTPAEGTELHITGTGDPIAGSSFNFTNSDGWLFFDQIQPSVVASKFLGRFLVRGARAVLDENIRIVQSGHGTVVIPHGPDFPALSVFPDKSLGGSATPLKCYVEYGAEQLKAPIGSFVLKRGYMATLAEKENGTGVSRNYVAQDHDIVVHSLPNGLDDGVRFIRVFPWRWVSKKGIAGGIRENLNVAWFYDWNIGAASSLDLEYVAIKQKRYWPGMDQDWRAKGINHLLGFNEPDRPDQANLKVSDAIQGWPELLGTGLRLGAPAVSDGGLGWLYEFMDEADKKGLRVDFVPVHYYRGISDPGDARGAADQLHDFLKAIHDRVKRPLWITEWNNGANWTNSPDPSVKQQKEAIEEMIKMLDETPFVERYALYNWVEDCRMVVAGDGSLTPAGVVYRDKVSPVSFVQPKSVK